MFEVGGLKVKDQIYGILFSFPAEGSMRLIKGYARPSKSFKSQHEFLDECQKHLKEMLYDDFWERIHD